jgi:zinc transport system substrate-binding protein
MFFVRRRFLIQLLLTLVVPTGTALAAPQVVVTIKPIHALVAGVMAGVGEPALLIGGSASPHSYTLRPSEARLLTQAQLIVRVGAGFETFLQRPLAGLAPTTRILTLDTLPGMRLLPTRSGGVWEAHEHDEDAAAHGERDLHLWLDPRNAQVIVAATAAALAELDPPQAALYRANAATLQQRLLALDADLQQRLAPLQRLPYAVFHDAFAYFEGRYGLTPLGAISVSSERPPGARRLAAIRARLLESGARCVFVQPQFEPKLAAQLISGTSARIAVLDDLGADLPAGPEAYFLLMERLGSALQNGLAPPP